MSHSWESAFKILSGGYEQVVGVGDTRKYFPEYVLGRFYMKPGSMYLMDSTQGWHRVIPSDTPSYSIMITTKVWPENKERLEKLMKKISKRDGTIRRIAEIRKEELLGEFKKILLG